MAHSTVDKPGESTVTINDADVIPEVDVTMEMVNNTAANNEGWLLYGNGPRGNRHVTDSQITPENVSNLTRVWEIDDLSGDSAEYQGTPLVVPGDPPIMYQTNGPDTTRAINARTGDILWTWSYEPYAGYGSAPADRGVTIIGDTIYRSTLDLGIIALDRYNADEQWYFNQGAVYRGEVADEPIHEELNFARGWGFTSSIPPIPYDGTLMKGSFGADVGVAGWIDGVNLDGSHEWRSSVVPEHRWVGDSWKHGGAAPWQPPAVDPDTGIAVFPTGNPGPDYNGAVRPGPNQFSAGKVAFDAETGDYLWDYQEVPHDVWDYDSPSPPVIFDAEVDGEERSLTTWAGKTGWLFTTDLETGELISRSEGFTQQFNIFDFPTKGEWSDWLTPYVGGGTDPQPLAIDEDRQVAIVKSENQPMRVRWNDIEYETANFYTGGQIQFPGPNAEIPEHNGFGGNISAVDPVTGDVLWQDWMENGSWGASFTTDTGLTFAGTGTNQFIAYDTMTGDRLWQDDLGVGVGGDPVTWVDPADGTQYVSVQGGGEAFLGGQGDVMVTYALE